MTTTLADEKVLEEPRWFGPSDRPLFGWMTWCRDTPSRGGVLLAPPIGREARAARRALRRAAIALAARGFVALRFDYDGTGDSSGAFDDAERDRAWASSVAEGAALLRGLGVERVSAVGMRLGATILAAAADAHDLTFDALVLWDPCETGRSYLRELGALESLRRDTVDAPAGSVETAEYVFSASAADEVRRLSLVTVERAPLATRLLVVAREDRAVSDRLRARLADERVEWSSTDEQGALLDVDPLVAKVPLRTIDAIVSWLTASSTPGTVLDVPDGDKLAVVERDGAEPVVTERCAHLGAQQLFGIVTEPVGPASGPLLVLLNVATDEHTGPSRLWVELSRRWARVGLRSVRFDLTGVGDSPCSAVEPQQLMYDPQWLDDMPEVARALCPEDPSATVFIGLCSGAYLAAQAGNALGATGVLIINPPVGMDFLAGVDRLAVSKHRALRRVAAFLREVAVRLRWLAVTLWQAGRVVMPPVFNVDILSRLAARGTDLFVLSSAEELSPFPSHKRLDRFFSPRLVAPSGYEVHFVEGLDHSMLAAAGRTRTIGLLDAHVRERYAPTAASSPDDHVHE